MTEFVIEVDELAPCPRCGSEPKFIERNLPTGTHASCKFVCASSKCGFRGPGVAQRIDLSGNRELHRTWGRVNAAKEWNLCATSTPIAR
jgi:predicted RNA-binding Zn-ribbon protein involved in translation (DUF1610 family)